MWPANVASLWHFNQKTDLSKTMFRHWAARSEQCVRTLPKCMWYLCILHGKTCGTSFLGFYAGLIIRWTAKAPPFQQCKWEPPNFEKATRNSIIPKSPVKGSTASAVPKAWGTNHDQNSELCRFCAGGPYLWQFQLGIRFSPQLGL